MRSTDSLNVKVRFPGPFKFISKETNDGRLVSEVNILTGLELLLSIGITARPALSSTTILWSEMKVLELSTASVRIAFKSLRLDGLNSNRTTLGSGLVYIPGSTDKLSLVLLADCVLCKVIPLGLNCAMFIASEKDNTSSPLLTSRSNCLKNGA